MRGIFHIGLLLLVSGSGLAQQQVGSDFGETRLALVIGNNQHPRVPLTNPVNDARAMQGALKGLGFQVTLLTDATRAQMKRGISTFVDSIKPDAVVIVYFAGHGVEFNNTNYLIPIDLAAEDKIDVEEGAINVSFLLERLEQSPARIRLLILDACRNNPYEQIRGLGAGGLAAMDKVTGSYVAFSTNAGGIAHDGKPGEPGGRASGPAGSEAKPGRGNSVFTAALVSELKNRQPGATVDEVFTNVRKRVSDQTKGTQTPYSHSGLLGVWYPFGRATLPEPTKYDIEASADSVEKAVRLITNGQNSEAHQALEAAVRSNWKNSLAYVYRGLLQGMDGKPADELSDFSQAIQVDPSNYLAYLNRGLALKSAGKCPDAIADFDRAAEKAPKKAAIYRYRAACLAEIGGFDKAEEDLQKAAALEGGGR